MALPSESKTIAEAEGIVLGRFNAQAHLALNPNGPVLNMFSPSQLAPFDIGNSMRSREGYQALMQAALNEVEVVYAAMMMTKDLLVFFDIALNFRSSERFSQTTRNFIEEVEPSVRFGAALRFGLMATTTTEEMESQAPASFNFTDPVDISQNTTGLDESLGFNAETGQHTVPTPGLSGIHGTGVLGNFNIETGMYNNFGPGVSGPTGAASGSTTGTGSGTGPASAPGAGEQSP